MILTLKRRQFTEKSTIGALFIDGAFACYTLEDVVRPEGEPKVYGKTAIPYGTYHVVLTNSKRFGKLLPELMSVPNFTGVRIHAGNSAADTDGCVLVGLTRSADWIGDSTVAMQELMHRLLNAKGPITIEITKES